MMNDTVLKKQKYSYSHLDEIEIEILDLNILNAANETPPFIQ